MDLSHAAPPASEKKRWYRQLYFYVLVAIVLGVVVGAAWPGVGVAMEPIGTAFVGLMKMLIGPIVFLTIVGGIASALSRRLATVAGELVGRQVRSPTAAERWPPASAIR